MYRTHIRWFDLLFNIKTHVNIKWIVINMTNNLSTWVWIYNKNFTGHTRYNVIGWQLEHIFSCSCWFKLRYLKRAHAINVIICDKLYIFFYMHPLFVIKTQHLIIFLCILNITSAISNHKLYCFKTKKTSIDMKIIITFKYL